MTDRTSVTETERDAERYRRLRVLGCAPAYTQHLTRNEVLRFTNLDAFVDEDIAAYSSRGEAKPGLAQCSQEQTAIDPEIIAKIDHLLAREEHDSGYSAFVWMRKIWPQLKTLADTSTGREGK